MAGIVAHTSKDGEFKISQGYIVRFSLKNKTSRI
jgi:hypothetical protein